MSFHPVPPSKHLSLEQPSGDHPSSEETFADLFAASMQQKPVKRRAKQISVGDVVSGNLVRIGKEFAFIDIGEKAEARMSIEDMNQISSEKSLELGDRLEGRVIQIDSREGGVVLSQHISKHHGLRGQLEMIFSKKIPIEGVVTGVNKGGLTLDLAGTQAFLPVSHIELRHCQNPASYVGQTLKVLITQYEEGRNVVVSRRLVLEQEQQEKGQQLEKKLIPGTVFLGKVTAVQDYGAFVDIGGIEGFVHVSEIGYGRDLKPQDLVSPGQSIEVLLLRVEDVMEKGIAKRKISLSMKALMKDPFSDWVSMTSEGQKITGRVVRLEPFGAFVELAKGVEGLLHISAISDRPIKHPREVLQLGQEVSVTVIRIDKDQHRIGLSMTEDTRLLNATAMNALILGDVISVVVEKVEPFGLLVRIPGQAGGHDAAPKGVIRNAELPQADKHELKRKFPVGKEVRAQIKRIDPHGRVDLSINGAHESEERASLSSYEQKTTSSFSKATFGDLLKKKGLIP